MLDVKEIKEKVAPLKILIVEDEELIRMLMNNFMSRLFDHVVSAENGEDALHKWEEFGPFDVVLTDVRMPKMTGKELVKVLETFDHRPYVIVVSASEEDAQEALEHSDVFIPKPLGFNQILETLSTMIQTKGV